MTNQEPHLNVQAVRRVYENQLPTSCSTTTLAPPGTIYLVCHPDDASGKDILLWDDILAAFKEDVIHVRYGAVVLPFLKGPNFKNLEPLRIAKIHGATLDIVAKGQLNERVLLVEPPQKGLITRREESNARPASASSTYPATIGRDPIATLTDEATESSTHNYHQNSEYIQNEREWQLQVVPYHIGNFYSNSSTHGKNNDSINSNYENSNRRNNNTSSARVLQVQVQSSHSTEDPAETMEKASQENQRELRKLLDNNNVNSVSESTTNPITVRRYSQTFVLDKTAENPTYSYNHILNSANLPDEQEPQYIPYHIREFNYSNGSNTIKSSHALLEQLAVIQGRIQAILTPTHELHEYSIPRLFVILPKNSSGNYPTSILNNQFQLYFLCECGEHAKVLDGVNTDTDIPHHIHIAKHEGYDLQRPAEFFRKYGRYMLTLLEMIKHVSTITGYDTPALSSVNVSGVTDILTNSQDTVTPSAINQSIKYLQTLLSEQDAAKNTSKDPFTEQEALGGTDLRHLEMFIKSKDQNRAFGNLYRTISEEGHVRWVCINYYRLTYKKLNQQALVAAVNLSGGCYNPELNRVTVSLESKFQASGFFNALSKAGHVDELVVAFGCEGTTGDPEAFASTLENAAVSILRLDFQRFWTYLATELESTNTLQQALARSINLSSTKMIHVVLPANLNALSILQPNWLSLSPKLSFEVVSRQGAFELGERGLTRLAEILKLNLTLTILDLRFSSVGENGAVVLSEALKVNSTLTTLNLNGNSIAENGAVALSEALKTNSTLTTLDLSFNSIKENGAVALSEAFETNSTLTTLDLSFNSIEENGAVALSEALKVNSTLTTLNLKGNSIAENGAVALSEALKVNSTLTTLNLRGNFIAENGAVALSEALKTNSTLTTLNLKGNSIAENGAVALSEALKTNSTLTTLSLSCNSIKENGAVALSEALKTNSTLTTLNLNGNSIAENGAVALSEALKTNSTLTVLKLDYNSIGDKGAMALSEALKTNSSLTTLDLEDYDRVLWSCGTV